MNRQQIANLLLEVEEDCSNVERNYDGRWVAAYVDGVHAVLNGIFLHNYEYRIKPEPEYIPYTEDDWQEFLGKQFKHHYTGVGLLPIDHDTEGVYYMFQKKARLYPYSELLKEYLHVDGTPAGRRVE